MMIDSMTSSHSIQIKDSQKGWTMFKPIYTETVRIPHIIVTPQSDQAGSECSSGSRKKASNSIRQTRPWSRETL
jgi:hypothetical protein